MQQRLISDLAFFSKDRPYGGLGGAPSGSKATLFFDRAQRQRLNIVSVLMCLFAPWLMFCFTYAATSFHLHYKFPALMYALVGLGLVIVLVFAAIALRLVIKKCRHEYHEPKWYIFLFITMLIAWSLGLLFGYTNFKNSMEPFYAYTNLDEYHNVDPSDTRGAQLMDAGRVTFVNGAGVDRKRSMGFRNIDTYCVAPITVDGRPLANYDFWAVGIGCCSGNTADFSCGEYDNPKAKAGLRYVRDEERAIFRLAVQQAEATYAIKSDHPLFFFWTQSADAAMASFRDAGYRFFLLGMLVHFCWQALCVGLAALGFSKLGQF
mmetsp:Transcript_113507/g.321173  ORF Transcript_113507/g.321173 Transcript_113507/m.321173 type:complete len:320 (-) Transcript_113507:80-1039(-)